MEEEALRPDRRRRAAAAAQAARPPAAPPVSPRRRGHGQSQGAALRQHEDGGLRGAEGQVRLLHGGHDGREGDRLQVPAGRGLERGDHLADGPVQEPAGDPGRQVYPAEAAAARRADARPEDGPQLPKRCVTCGEPRGHWCAICGKTAKTEREKQGGFPGPGTTWGSPSKLRTRLILLFYSLDISAMSEDVYLHHRLQSSPTDESQSECSSRRGQNRTKCGFIFA